MKGTGPAGKGGFTLLELMFAAGIVGLALAFLFGSLITISIASNLTQNRAIAGTHIVRVFEELRGASLQQILTYTPPVIQELGPSASETVRLEALLGAGYVVLPVDPTTVASAPNPLLLRCTVTWTGAENRPLSLDASQFFYR